MRTFPVLYMAMIMLLPSAAFAEGRYECLLRCSAEKDLRNADCPSPFEISTAPQMREQCRKINQSTYVDCFLHCPPQSVDLQIPDEHASSPAMPG